VEEGRDVEQAISGQRGQEVEGHRPLVRAWWSSGVQIEVREELQDAMQQHPLLCCCLLSVQMRCL
jgi:hypothetical protein